MQGEPGTLYKSCMNTDAIEALGAAPLLKFFADIDKIVDKQSLTDYLVRSGRFVALPRCVERSPKYYLSTVPWRSLLLIPGALCQVKIGLRGKTEFFSYGPEQDDANPLEKIMVTLCPAVIPSRLTPFQNLNAESWMCLFNPARLHIRAV